MMMWYATPRHYIIFRIIQILGENESIITEFNFPRKKYARKHCSECYELSSKLREVASNQMLGGQMGAKSLTGENAFLVRSSQQLLRLCLRPLKGFIN